MKELRTEIEINASVEAVWEVLMDFDAFPTWNPFIQSISGKATEGSGLNVRIVPPGGQAMTFHPKVTQVRAGCEFRWLGHLGMPGIFDGEHIFQLEALADQRTKFVQRECFRGLLLPLFWKTLNSKTRTGFEQMNQSLKHRVEQATQLR